MRHEVGIVGTGQTLHCLSRRDVTAPELVQEAVRAAREDAGVGPEEIDAVVIGNMEHFEGIHLSDIYASEGADALGRTIIKVATGGCTGSSLAQAAAYLVGSGMYETVLAIGWERLSDSAGETSTGIVTAFDPLFERSTLGGAISGLAVQAGPYVDRYGIAPQDAANVTVQARQNAARNPNAHLRKPVLVDDVMASPLLSWPLRFLDMCPTSDGACAVLFASGDWIRRKGRKAAWLHGISACRNHALLGDVMIGVPTFINPLKIASAKAYEQAGIRDPRREIDVVELYDPCTYAALEWVEDLGLCGAGEGAEFYGSGAAAMDGEVAVNPSGGVLCTNPIGATGLIRVAEAAMQILGRAGEHQVPEVKTAVATGFGGSLWHEVMVFKC
ncbi:MAG: thiolase C-terminal domain-containing protein [Candidatus Xenobia bacterium]